MAVDTNMYCSATSLVPAARVSKRAASLIRCGVGFGAVFGMAVPGAVSACGKAPYTTLTEVLSRLGFFTPPETSEPAMAATASACSLNEGLAPSPIQRTAIRVRAALVFMEAMSTSGPLLVKGEALRAVSWVCDHTNYRHGGFMKMDRGAHRKMLTDAAECYPHYVEWDLAEFPDLSEEDVAGNLFYLQELGLVRSGIQMGADGTISWGLGRATAAGLDFIQDDGGYTAILGTVTIKLHEDTLKDLLSQKVQESNLSTGDKKKWTDGLRALPADAIKHLSLKLIDVGMSHGPDGLHWLGRYLGMT